MRDPSMDSSAESASGTPSDADNDVISLAEQREFRHGEIAWLAPAVIVGTLVLFVALVLHWCWCWGPKLKRSLAGASSVSLLQPVRRRSTSLGSCIRLRQRPELSH